LFSVSIVQRLRSTAIRVMTLSGVTASALAQALRWSEHPATGAAVPLEGARVAHGIGPACRDAQDMHCGTPSLSNAFATAFGALVRLLRAMD
jgi:hypothetical protein